MNIFKIIFLIILFFFNLVSELSAYIGLGPLIPIIGSSIAFIFGLIIVIIGFFSYPIIKFYNLLKKRNKKKYLKEKRDVEHK